MQHFINIKPLELSVFDPFPLEFVITPVQESELKFIWYKTALLRQHMLQHFLSFTDITAY